VNVENFENEVKGEKGVTLVTEEKGENGEILGAFVIGVKLLN